MSFEDDDDIRAMTSKFEAVQIAMNKDKNGYVLKLAVNPVDAPEDLLRDPVGTRYMIVAVRLNGQDEPVPSKQTTDGNKALKIAGMLCQDERFQEWLMMQNLVDELSEDAAAKAIRTVCGIASRAELKTNSEARKAFLALTARFDQHLRRTGG